MARNSERPKSVRSFESSSTTHFDRSSNRDASDFGDSRYVRRAEKIDIDRLLIIDAAAKFTGLLLQVFLDRLLVFLQAFDQLVVGVGDLVDSRGVRDGLAGLHLEDAVVDLFLVVQVDQHLAE